MSVCQPPPLRKKHRRLFCWRKLRLDEIDHELIWLSTAVGAVVFGSFWIRTGRPLPPCVFHALTGLPCPTCGCTRATLKLLAGDITGAIALNPLYIFAACIGIAYCLYAAVVLIGRLPRLRIEAPSPEMRRLVRWTAIAAVLGNWAWLIYQGI